MGPPKGLSRFARSTSTWIHWWSWVASANLSTWSWVISTHSLWPRCWPTFASTPSMPSTVVCAMAPPLIRGSGLLTPPHSATARGAGLLRLGGLSVPDGAFVVMAIVNRTPDSFYDRGATYALDAAVARVDQVVSEGADMVDVGGVKAAPGDEVDAAEEIRRTADLVAAIRAAHPALPISIDTWRASVAREVLTVGADVVNDAWGGVDPSLAAVAAEAGAGIVCTHAGGLPPRTPPPPGQYHDRVADNLP